jgi:hypothetical protein
VHFSVEFFPWLEVQQSGQPATDLNTAPGGCSRNLLVYGLTDKFLLYVAGPFRSIQAAEKPE